MAAPAQDPNAAPAPPGGGLEDLFEDLDDGVNELLTHARAHGQEEKEVVVQLDDSTVVGLLPKKLSHLSRTNNSTRRP